MDANHRLHLATKIHFGLLRHLGEGIDIGALLKREDYALDVINVCLACDDAELRGLAESFKGASTQPTPDPGPALRAPHASPWAAQTSGFGLSEPPPGALHSTPGVAPGARWWERWLRYLAPRAARAAAPGDEDAR